MSGGVLGCHLAGVDVLMGVRGRRSNGWAKEGKRAAVCETLSGVHTLLTFDPFAPVSPEVRLSLCIPFMIPPLSMLPMSPPPPRPSHHGTRPSPYICMYDLTRWKGSRSNLGVFSKPVARENSSAFDLLQS